MDSAKKMRIGANNALDLLYCPYILAGQLREFDMARNERRMVDYEWTVEEVDENGDIQDVNFWPEAELASAQEFLQAAGPNYRIGLATRQHACGGDWRNDGTTDEESRDYAYPDASGYLPDECDFGAPVPMRFRKRKITA